MAWVRSTLALLGVSTLVARLAFLADWRVGTGVAAAAVVFGAPLLGSTVQRYERSAMTRGSGGYLPDGRLPGYTAAFVIVVGAAGLALIVSQ